jgi:hypothetical protein
MTEQNGRRSSPPQQKRLPGPAHFVLKLALNNSTTGTAGTTAAPTQDAWWIALLPLRMLADHLDHSTTQLESNNLVTIPMTAAFECRSFKK